MENEDGESLRQRKTVVNLCLGWVWDSEWDVT